MITEPTLAELKRFNALCAAPCTAETVWAMKDLVEESQAALLNHPNMVLWIRNNTKLINEVLIEDRP